MLKSSTDERNWVNSFLQNFLRVKARVKLNYEQSIRCSVIHLTKWGFTTFHFFTTRKFQFLNYLKSRLGKDVGTVRQLA